MLDGREEEGAVYEGVAVEDQQHLVAQHAGRPGGSLGGQRGEDEPPRLVIAVVAVILHLLERKPTKEQTQVFILALSF